MFYYKEPFVEWKCATDINIQRSSSINGIKEPLFLYRCLEERSFII